MPRILINECKQEVSSFNPVIAGLDAFLIQRGAKFFAYHRGVRNEVGGALAVFDSRPSLEIISGYSARGITSSGTVSSEAFLQIASHFLDAVRDAGKLDGIYFALHGALAAEDVEERRHGS